MFESHENTTIGAVILSMSEITSMRPPYVVAV